MADVNDTFLILHGWGGNKPAHWQEHLVAALIEAGATVHYPKMPNPVAPDKVAWLASLNKILMELSMQIGKSPLTVVGHSLGAITWMHYAASERPILVADRVLLVAPPYVIPEIPPTDAPPGVPTFFPPPISAAGIARAGRETTIVASDNDDYATFEQTKAYSDRLEIPIHLLSGAGHISPYWGYGEWPWVLDWCLRRAELPPVGLEREKNQPNKKALPMAYEGKAAILSEAGKDAEIVDITIDPPGPNEVLVKLVASGVCHTDLTVKNLNGNGMAFPIVLGHEGAGYIEAVGEGVTHLKVGDPVVIAYRAPCEECPACRRGDPRHCYMALRPQPRIHRKSDGVLCSQVLRCGTFATRTVVHAKAAIKMPSEMPLDKACLIACGVVTGVGATMNTTPVAAGSRVAVIGCGGVGLSVIQGARLMHARQIIAVDVNPTKLQWAKEFGATHEVNPRDGDPVAAVRALTEDGWDGGVEYAFEATGIPLCTEQAIKMLAYDGTATTIGFPAASDAVTLNLGDMATGVYWNKASLRVCHCGDALPSHDFPLLAQLYLEGQLNLDRMVTQEIALEDVEAAFHRMESGDVIRSVIRFPA